MKQPRWLASLSILLWVAGMLCIMHADIRISFGLILIYTSEKVTGLLK
jgi:hypothetical protein